jgi:DNA-binding TFAR19-related protein (PDSD5 family)
MENKKKQALGRILDSEARQRLERIRMVNKDKAEYFEYLLIHLASENRLRLPMGDEDFKTFILSNSQTKREIVIRQAL